MVMHDSMVFFWLFLFFVKRLFAWLKWGKLNKFKEINPSFNRCEADVCFMESIRKEKKIQFFFNVWLS